MKYDVMIPVAGFVNITVNADSPEAAIDAAMEEDFEITDIQDVNPYREVCTGNVCNLEYQEAEAIESEEPDDSDPEDANLA